MTALILTGLILATLLIQGLSAALRHGMESQDDSVFRNDNGDHVYYERSIIEKKLFHQLYPNKTIRSFASLFKLR